jgi:hypothetical protein
MISFSVENLLYGDLHISIDRMYTTCMLLYVALPERIFTRGRTSALPDEPAKRAF